MLTVYAEAFKTATLTDSYRTAPSGRVRLTAAPKTVRKGIFGLFRRKPAVPAPLA